MSNNHNMNQNKPVNRPERKPLIKQDVLTYNCDENFNYYVVNELPGAIEAHKLAGWEIVNDPLADTSDDKAGKASQMGGVCRRVVNQDPNAPCRYGILMRKPKNWYDEDAKLQQEEADRIERELDPAKYKQGDTDSGEMKYTNGSMKANA